jgi:hypothetical protein
MCTIVFARTMLRLDMESGVRLVQRLRLSRGKERCCIRSLSVPPNSRVLSRHGKQERLELHFRIEHSSCYTTSAPFKKAAKEKKKEEE